MFIMCVYRAPGRRVHLTLDKSSVGHGDALCVCVQVNATYSFFGMTALTIALQVSVCDMWPLAMAAVSMRSSSNIAAWLVVNRWFRCRELELARSSACKSGMTACGA